jgi:hypothetical protein
MYLCVSPVASYRRRNATAQVGSKTAGVKFGKIRASHSGVTLPSITQGGDKETVRLCVVDREPAIR